MDPSEQELPFQALGVESPAPGREPSEGPFFPGKGGMWSPSRSLAGSHGQLGAVGAQPVLVEAAAHAPPQRVGPAVRLVPEICGEPGVRSAGTDTRTHGTRRTDRERPAGSQSKQLVEDGSRDRPRRSAGSRTDVPGTTRPSDRLILVGSGCWWDHGNCAVGMAPTALTKATAAPVSWCEVCPGRSHTPSNPGGAGGCSTSRQVWDPWVQPHQDGFRIPTSHLAWKNGIIQVGKGLQDLKEVPWVGILQLPAHPMAGEMLEQPKEGRAREGTLSMGWDGWMEEGES